MSNSLARIIKFRGIRWFVAVLGVDIVFFNLVNPTAGSSFIAILGCFLLIATIYSLLRLLLDIMAFFIAVPDRVRKRFTVALTMIAAYLIVMQSIGQLSMRDVLAIIPLAAVLYFYLSYSAAKQR